ncbi:FAD-dependent oxidoreductase [Actinoplanes sp. NPDC049118]|uniref:FAD-dependent oxidoreductase n=1 Tax=Actinoplanes sp. NPDC049118 TaxID=3155769 RepID=UPI003406CD84
MSPARWDVLLIGAGVSGLTTAVRLAEEGVRVLVRARGRPEQTTSAAAGAIWDPICATHPLVPQWSSRAYDVFREMVRAGRPEVSLVHGIEASRTPIPSPRWAHDLPGFRECDPGELPPGFGSGWRYTAPIIDMPPYLGYLERRLLAAGGALEIAEVHTLDGAPAPVVVNCSGIGARQLVPDPEVAPVRGQLVAVRNPGVTEFFAEHTAQLDELTYLLPQGRTLLLGGSEEKGRFDPEPDLAVAEGIIERCAGIVPAIATARVLGHRTGIRPDRPRIRLEQENRDGRHVVHNYGHGGAGVSLSWGCADSVLELVRDLI